MSLAPNFLDLPTELKCKVLSLLDTRSLLRMSSTCKVIQAVIYTFDEFNLRIEMAMSGLVPATRIRATAVARKHLRTYLNARLNFPIEKSLCVSFPAPEGVVMEKLFRGLFACLDDDSILHVWDVRYLYPQKILYFEVEDMIDFVIEPEFGLVVALCHNRDDDHATILFLDYSNQAHPWASLPVITHPLLPGAIIFQGHGTSLLKFSGELLAFSYFPDDEVRARGIVWHWRTGNCIYDSAEFESHLFFHDLLLLPYYQNAFIVGVSSFRIEGAMHLGAWIELRQANLHEATSHLIAEFHFPEFAHATESYISGMIFDDSEPSQSFLHSVSDENIFPFISNPHASVHVLNLRYCGLDPEVQLIEGPNSVYIIIGNGTFHEALDNWTRKTDVQGNRTLFPIRREWREWGPQWTSFWDYKEFGGSTGTSSVCGSRVYYIFDKIHRPNADFTELTIVDFNMNFPCSQRDCNDLFAHFKPKTFPRGIWVQDIHTWLPFHVQRRYFRIEQQTESRMECSALFMDEERLILTMYPYQMDHHVDPAEWKVFHLVADQTIQENCLSLISIEKRDDKPSIKLQDRICRLCRTKSHTDAHILLECTANRDVVALRQRYTKDCPPDPELTELWQTQRFDEMFNNILTRRDWIRKALSFLAVAINEIYRGQPSCSELVPAEEQNPSSRLFVVEAIPRWEPSPGILLRPLDEQYF